MSRLSWPPPELLAAVRAAPNDDAPRLVLADWLQERGQAWGELIAVQCALARENGPTEARAKLLRREHALLEARADWWRSEGVDVTSFSRGFPHTIRAAPSKLKSWSLPDVDDLEIAAGPGDMHALAEVARLPTRGITLEALSSHGFTRDDAHLFTNWCAKRSLRLRGLGLRGRAHRKALDALFEALPSLEDVRLERIGASVRSTWFDAPLRRLALRGVGFDGFGFFLAEGLEDVELSNMMLERRAPDVVMRLTKVAHLELSSTGLDEVALRRLLERTPPTLRGLGVANNRIGDAAVELLATRPFDRLDISENGLTKEIARHLLDSPALPPSLVLTVSANEIGPEHLDALRERFAVVRTR